VAGERDGNLRARHQERYIEHARRLQTWIGGYGVGLAGLFVVQARTTLAEIRLINPGLSEVAHTAALAIADLEAERITTALAKVFVLIGIALAMQVVILLVNKVTQLEMAHFEGAKAQSWWTRACSRVADWDLLDLLADVVSIGFLAWATYEGLANIVLIRYRQV
jgi:hypothetical protein